MISVSQSFEMLENCHHVRGGNKSDRLYVVAGVHIKFDPTAELGLTSYKFRNFASKKRIFMMSLDPEQCLESEGKTLRKIYTDYYSFLIIITYHKNFHLSFVLSEGLKVFSRETFHSLYSNSHL